MSRRIQLLASLAALAAGGPLGCSAQRPPVASPVARPREALALAVQVVTGEAPNWQPVAPGSALHDGDLLRVEVQVTRSAYVYVAQAPPDGAPEVLYPGSGDVTLAPRRALRIPEEARGLRLSGAPGEEVLYVVAAERPLCQGDRALADRLHVVCDRDVAGRPAEAPLATRAAAPPPPPPPPRTITVGSRGDFFEDNAPPQVQRIRADGRGVALLRFAYRHER